MAQTLYVTLRTVPHFCGVQLGQQYHTEGRDQGAGMGIALQPPETALGQDSPRQRIGQAGQVPTSAFAQFWVAVSLEQWASGNHTSRGLAGGGPGGGPGGRVGWAQHYPCHSQTAEMRTWGRMCLTASVRSLPRWDPGPAAPGKTLGWWWAPTGLLPGSSALLTWELTMGPQAETSKMPGSGGSHHMQAVRTAGALCVVTSGPSVTPPPAFLQLRSSPTGWTATARSF